MKKFISVLSALAVTAMPLTAFAENTEINEKSDPQSAQTVITTDIDPSYIVTIPSDTNVKFNTLENDFGNIELTEAQLEPGKAVLVHLESDYSLKNKTDDSKTIPYDITTTDDSGLKGSLQDHDVLLEFQGDASPLTIEITQDDWNKAYAGEYSDTVTFDVSYIDPATLEEDTEQ